MRDTFAVTNDIRSSSVFKRGGLVLLILVVFGIMAVNSLACVKTGHVGEPEPR